MLGSWDTTIGAQPFLCFAKTLQFCKQIEYFAFSQRLLSLSNWVVGALATPKAEHQIRFGQVKS